VVKEKFFLPGPEAGSVSLDCDFGRTMYFIEV